MIRADRIALEWYGKGFDASETHYTASLAKSLVGGMSLLLALHDGRIEVDDLAAEFVPQWRHRERAERITIGQLASHSSGLEDAEQGTIPHPLLTGWKGAFWKREPDPFTIARDRAPVLFEPGTGHAYSNPGTAMLGYAVTAALSGSEHEDIRSLLRERVIRPIGIGWTEWSIGYGETYEVDGLDLVATWGGAAFTPRATARVGRLMLRGGDWDGRRIIDRKWVEAVLSYDRAPLPSSSDGEPAPVPTLGWWTNANGTMRNVPRDAFWGTGAGDQFLIVVPSLDLIVVRYGQNMYDGQRGETPLRTAERFLFEPVIAALDVRTPPASEVIRGVTFAPLAEIRRDASGSDNWPITWGDDDQLYTSYGDGWGFGPRTGRKLSMGFARLEGAPESYRASNIRSPSGERTGEGAAGAKASGLLMVDGVLYAWVRNTGNATLISSTNRGSDWEWGFTWRTSFATPTFVQFGKNYTGARDDYAYVVSQDGDDAYRPSDGVVLARARTARMRDSSAWEYYAGESAGEPRWSRAIDDRMPIVKWPGRAERTDVVYNAGLRRYLMTLGFGHGRGWAILDAPEPWGPWTLAFRTDAWDVPGTHGYRLPTKWISEDGTEMWLVYSGLGVDDAFCLRRMTLELAGLARTSSEPQ